MRKEPFIIGDYVHVYNRGNRKALITYDENDRWRFLKILRYLNNNESSRTNTLREVNQLLRFDLNRNNGGDNLFLWPSQWSEQEPLVKILCFCLMPNHFHLLLKEIQEGGITKFMKKFGNSFTGFINLKYNESGKVFQGSYKARTVKDMGYLQYLNVYIQLLNPFELFPSGIEAALKDFDKAFEFAMNYKFGSLPDFLGKRNLRIIEKDIFKEIFLNLNSYKEFSRDAVLRKNLKQILGKLAVD